MYAKDLRYAGRKILKRLQKEHGIFVKRSDYPNTLEVISKEIGVSNQRAEQISHEAFYKFYTGMKKAVKDWEVTL